MAHWTDRQGAKRVINIDGEEEEEEERQTLIAKTILPLMLPATCHHPVNAIHTLKSTKSDPYLLIAIAPIFP